MAEVKHQAGRWSLIVCGLTLGVEGGPNWEYTLAGERWTKHTLEQAAARINAAATDDSQAL